MQKWGYDENGKFALANCSSGGWNAKDMQDIVFLRIVIGFCLDGNTCHQECWH
jgi:hypothetical protein